MFGYITPLKEELKVREHEAFKAYYCGLCSHIKQNFGQVPRMVLNYDLVALALLLDGLSPNKAYLQKRTCMVHPLKTKPMIVNNEALSYAASMNVSLAYYKLLDDIQDEGSLKSEALASLLKPYSLKFSPEVTKINHLIERELHNLHELETSKDFTSIDEISHPSSLIVANILKYYPFQFADDSPSLRKKLFDFGYALGKWIYIIDALDDLEKDMKSNKFNPICVLYNQENFSYSTLITKVREPISFTLLNCGYTCSELLKSLPLKRHRVILNNIINLGMMDKYNKIISTCTHCKGGK
nr:DUF5685 family protein [uncultured Niameybacter sp.]